MSVIDERIVQMKFDNKLFEKNVATSISTLDKLKKALRFDGIDHNLQELSGAINAISFSKLAGHVDEINSRFSAFGVAGMTVIQDLTRAAERLGISLYNSTLGQIKRGGWSRATNIDKAKFAIEGLKMSWDELEPSISAAVNDTRFGFDEAATAASQLAASNVKVGEDMDNALKSIANVASQTGAEYSEIGHIYTVIAGNGKLMTEQMQQFSYRGFNAAAAMASVWGITEAEVRDMVSKGEVDFKKFSDAMNEYLGEGAKRANETFEGSMANMKAALSRIGQPFAESIRKYSVPVFNNLKEVIKGVKGELEPVNKIFDDFMAKASGFAVNVLQRIDLAPLENFINKFKEAYQWFDTFMTAVNPLWGKIEKAEESAAETTEKIAKSEADLTEVAQKVLSGFYGNGEERRKALEADGYVFEQVQNKVNELSGATFRYKVTEEEVTEAVKENTEEQKKGIDVTREAYQNYVKQQKELAKSKQRQQKINDLIKKTQPIAEGATSALNILKNTASAVAEGGFEPMFNILTSGASIILDLVGSIGKMITGLDELLTKSGAYDTLQRGINSILTDFSGTVSSIAETVTSFVSDGGGLDKFIGIFTDSPEGVEKLADSLGAANTSLGSFFDALKDFVISDGAKGLDAIVESLVSLVPILGKLQPLIMGIVGNVVGVKATQALSSLLDVVRLAPKYLKSIIHENNADALYKLAKSVGIFAIAMFALANLSWDQISHGAAAIGAIAAAVTELWYAFNELANFDGQNDITSIIGSFVNSLANKNNANAILKLSGAVAILAIAFAGLAQLEWEQIGKGAAALTELVGTLALLWGYFTGGLGFGGKKSGKADTPIGELANSLGKDSKKLSEVITNSETSIFEKLKGVASGLGGKLTDIANTAKSAISNALGVIWTDSIRIIENYTKSVANDKNATALLKIAGAIAVVAAAFWGLAHLEWDQIAKGAVAIGAVAAALLIMSVALALIRKVGKTKLVGNDNPLAGLTTMLADFGDGAKKMLNKFGIAALIVSIGIAVLAIGKVIVDLTAIPWQQGLNAVGLMGLVLLELTGAIFLLTKISGGKLKTSALMFAIGHTVKALGSTLGTLGSMSLGQGLKSVLLLGVVLVELWGALTLISNIGNGKSSPLRIAVLIAAIGLAINLIGSVLDDLSLIPLASGLKAAAFLGIVLLELWAALELIAGTESTGGVLGKAALLFTLSEVVKGLGTTLAALGALPFEDAMKGVFALGGVLLELALTLRLAGGGSAVDAIAKSTFLGSLTAVVAGMAGAIFLLSKIDASDITKALFAIASVSLIMLGVMKLASMIGGGGIVGTMSSFKTVLPMIATLAAVVGALYILSTIDTDQLQASVSALGKVLLSIAAVFGSMSLSSLFGGNLSAGNTAVSFLGVAAIILEIAGVFYLLQDLDADQMLSISESLSKFIKAIALVSFAASAVSLTGGGMMAFGSITGVVAAVTAIEGLAAAIEHFTGGKASKAIEEGLPLLESIARGIGRVMGVILEEGLLKPLNNTFGNIPTQLGDFMEGIKPVLSGFEDLDTTGLDQIKDILKKIAAIEAEGLIASVLKALTGNNGLITFAGDMKIFANALNDYCDTIKNGAFDKSTVEATKDAADMLTELADAIPDSDLIEKLFDETDFKQFSEDLGPFAEGLNDFCEKLSGGNFNSEVAEKGAAAGQVLAAFATEVPEYSLLDKITGMTDMLMFADDLPILATKLGEFCNNLATGGFKSAMVEDASASAEMLAAFAKEIPETSLFDKLFGTDLEVFAKDLPLLATGLGDYCTNLKNNGFDANQVTTSNSAVEMLIGLTKEIDYEGGVIGWLTGKSTKLGDFADQLVELGEGLAGYVTALEDGGFKASAIRNSNDAVDMLIKMSQEIPDVGGGLLGWITGGMLENFGDQLEDFGSGIATYASTIAGVSDGDLAKATNSVEMVRSLVGVFNELNSIGDASYGAGNAGDTMNAIWNYYDVADAVSGFFTQLKDAFTESGQDIESLHETMKNVGADIVTWIQEGLETSSESGGAESTLQSIGMHIAEGLGDESTLSEVKTNATALGEAIIDALLDITGEDGSLNGFTDSVIESITEMIGTVVKTLSDTTLSISGVGYLWAKSISTGMSSSVGLVKSAATQLGNAVVSTLKTFTSSMSSVGTSWVSNLSSGITRAQTTLNTTARTSGTTAGRAFTSGFQTTAEFKPGEGPQGDSPMLQAGRDAGAALTEGITDSADKGTTAFTDSVATMASYANAVMNEALDTNPVITPVLDMSNIQPGMIDNYLGTSDIEVNTKGASSYTTGLLSGVGGTNTSNLQARLNNIATMNTLNGIRSDIKDLGDSMSHMQMVMNGGALVGQIGTTMDRQLGSIQRFKERWA